MTGAGIVVRAAVAADADAIVDMVASLSRQDGDPDNLFDRTRVEADLFGKRPWLRGEMAVAGAKAVGVALWHFAYEPAHAARGAFVASLWVEPDFRRRGVATRLVSAVAQKAAREGGTFLWWASKPRNERAHATYASWGAGAEPVVAHALTGNRFEALAQTSEEGERP